MKILLYLIIGKRHHSRERQSFCRFVVDWAELCRMCLQYNVVQLCYDCDWSRFVGSLCNSLEWYVALRWCQIGCDSISNHQPHDCLFHRLSRRRSKKTSQLRVTGLCARNSPGTGEFSAQMASNGENVSIWWRHHVQRGYPGTEW